MISKVDIARVKDVFACGCVIVVWCYLKYVFWIEIVVIVVVVVVDSSGETNNQRNNMLCLCVCLCNSKRSFSTFISFLVIHWTFILFDWNSKSNHPSLTFIDVVGFIATSEAPGRLDPQGWWAQGVARPKRVHWNLDGQLS
jgi:hypothetical protein